MLGMMYYSLFLVMGVLYSDIIFKEKSIWFKIWAGGIMGNIMLMFGIIPFAIVFGFNQLSHILLALTVMVVYLCLKRTPNLQLTMPRKPAEIAVGAVALLICGLFSNHILVQTDSGFGVGQSTYGDLAMHLGFVTSIAEQRVFPPEYNLLSGERLCYPFLIDSLSSSLYLFGTSLRTAVLYPSFVFAWLSVAGFYFLAEKLTKNSKTGILSVILFFLGGGFGFAYFLEGAKSDSSIFTRIFTEFYKTPTNLNEMNIRWANPICDMIVPQRTTMAGWCVLFFALWLLVDALENKKKSIFLLLGAVAGAMPMIHTHSFLALGVISAVVFFAFIGAEENKKDYIISWCIYGSAAMILAMPQLMFWTFSQSVGNSQFLRFGFNWVNHTDPYLWFWLKNWGITAVFAVPAILWAKGTQKKFLLGAAVIFVIAELVIFQPNEYDNNKLFFVVYMLLVIAVSDYLLMIYGKLRSISGIKVLAATVVFFAVCSGVLTIGREYKSGGEYHAFTKSDVEFAQFVKDNTEPGSVFASGNQHWNPVCVLAGRNVYAGSELYIYFHGYQSEMKKRYDILEKIYKSKSAESLEHNLKDAPEIDYILITNNEKNTYNITESAFSQQKKVYDRNGISLYKVKY